MYGGGVLQIPIVISMIVLVVVKRKSIVVEEVVVEMDCGGFNAAAESVDNNLFR